MKLHRLYMLRKKELAAIHESLGGKISLKERLKRDGHGSPFLYFSNGHPGLEELNERAVDELRIVFEEFRNGLMLTATERTEPYIMPITPDSVEKVTIQLTEEKVTPRNGSFFNWLLKKGLALKTARFFAGSNEYQESKTQFSLQAGGETIHAWKTAEEFQSLVKFFQQTQFWDKVEVSS